MSVITYVSLINLGVLPAYNFFSWLIFFIITNLFLKTNIFNKILKKEIIILTILFSLLGIYGTVTYSILDSKELGLFYELLTLKNLLNTIGTFNIIFILLTNIVPKIDKYNIKNKKSIINKKWLIFLISFLCIFLCWLPYFLTFFPGTISPDSLSELTMVIENFTKMSDHHPILHVLFIGIPYKIGYTLLGTANGGVAFSTLTQMLCMASIFSSFILFLYNRKTSDIILLITLLFYSILPMHGYFSIVMWKDVMFAGMLLLLTMQLIKILEKEKNSELSFCSLIPFIIVSILCVFFRNNAIYMYVILAAFMLVVLKNKKIFYSFCIVSFS